MFPILWQDDIVIMDNLPSHTGFSAEVAARVSEKCFSHLKAPVRRIGSEQTPCPTVRELENEFYANASDIVGAVEDMLGVERSVVPPELLYSHERRFKGPF